ncbi:hypothetical protein D3874_21980 [Oleomonas cavernae]|uniref:Uncharacterized protein n=1 Tax=Oleomonas cavernae TaxID=2320859 RepID=A0A418WGZ4_9PROT|nr:hypothetical protein D3874_21980 [Oleomonas cavernae]
MAREPAAAGGSLVLVARDGERLEQQAQDPAQRLSVEERVHYAENLIDPLVNSKTVYPLGRDGSSYTAASRVARKSPIAPWAWLAEQWNGYR